MKKKLIELKEFAIRNWLSILLSIICLNLFFKIKTENKIEEKIDQLNQKNDLVIRNYEQKEKNILNLIKLENEETVNKINNIYNYNYKQLDSIWSTINTRKNKVSK